MATPALYYNQKFGENIVDRYIWNLTLREACLGRLVKGRHHFLTGVFRSTKTSRITEFKVGKKVIEHLGRHSCLKNVDLKNYTNSLQELNLSALKWV